MTTASADPFLVAAMGSRRCRAPPGFSRYGATVPSWTGVGALIGTVGSLIAFVAVLDGLGEDSLFGFGFFPGVLALVVWSAATSIRQYRALAPGHE